KDKSPYKTHFAASLAPGGRKSMIPGYYIHCGPFESYVAGGAYQPKPATLLSIRQAIAAEDSSFFEIINDKTFAKTFGDLPTGHGQLKTVPKGFAKDHPAAKYLKLQSFIVSKTLNRKQFANPENVIELIRIMYPLINFLRQTAIAGK